MSACACGHSIEEHEDGPCSGGVVWNGKTEPCPCVAYEEAEAELIEARADRDYARQERDEAKELLSRTCGPVALEDLRRQCRQAEARADALEKALLGFFTPGPGIAMPEWYHHPSGERDDSEPYKKTWNAKLDALKAALAGGKAVPAPKVTPQVAAAIVDHAVRENEKQAPAPVADEAETLLVKTELADLRTDEIATIRAALAAAERRGMERAAVGFESYSDNVRFTPRQAAAAVRALAEQPETGK